MKSGLFWLNLFADLMRFSVRGGRSKTSLAAEKTTAMVLSSMTATRSIPPKRTVIRKIAVALRLRAGDDR
jgi:hypothetical protein